MAWAVTRCMGEADEQQGGTKHIQRLVSGLIKAQHGAWSGSRSLTVEGRGHASAQEEEDATRSHWRRELSRHAPEIGEKEGQEASGVPRQTLLMST